MLLPLICEDLTCRGNSTPQLEPSTQLGDAASEPHSRRMQASAAGTLSAWSSCCPPGSPTYEHRPSLWSCEPGEPGLVVDGRSNTGAIKPTSPYCLFVLVFDV